jgi:hypothetical protein
VLTDPDHATVSLVALLSPLGSVGNYRPSLTGTMLLAGDPRTFAVIKADQEWRPVTIAPPRRRKNRDLLDKVAEAFPVGGQGSSV